MKLFLHLDPKTIFESHIPSNPVKQLDEIDIIADSIDSHLSKEVKIPKDVLNSFKIKDSLNPDIWPNNQLNPSVKTKLLQIAKDFYQKLEIEKKAKIKDIIFTGSLANFNWSKFSDIDLHLVIDFNDFDADNDMVEEYFYAQKAIWNQEHDINVFGFPVEIYVQDINDDLVASAVYSVLNNKWLKKPTRETFNLDKETIKNKAMRFINQLRDIRKLYQADDYKAVVDKVTKLRKKIKNMRSAGLEKGGEYSLENLVFKTLRRTPFLDIIDSFKAKAYDKLMSISEIKDVSLIDENDALYKQGGVLLIKGAPLSDGKQRMYVTTIKNLMELNRLKKNDTKAQPAKMAILGNQIYIVSFVDGKLRPQGVSWNTEDSMLKVLGLSRRDIVLNNNKTPLHWETLRYNNIPMAINAISNQLLNIPNIRWIG